MTKTKKQKKNSLEYWKDRTDEILAFADQADLEFFAELSKLYTDEALTLQKELYNFILTYAEDGSMTYEEALERLRGEDLSDYRANATKYRKQAEKDPELLKRLNEQYQAAKATRMDVLNLELTYRLGVLNGKLQTSFDQHLQKVARYAYRKAYGGLSGTINEPALRELVRMPWRGTNYSIDVWKNLDRLGDDLRQVLARGFVRGDHSRVMAQELNKKYNVARAKAQALVRTEGTAVITRATIRRYQEAGLEYYRILVHLDNRTSEICKDIHKQAKRCRLDEMEIGLNAPPFHVNCRSGILPDGEEIGMETERDLDNRISYGSPESFNRISGDIEAKKVNGSNYEKLYVSDKLRGRKIPAKFHGDQLKQAFSIIEKRYNLNDLEKPKVVVTGKGEMASHVLASYDRKNNTLFVRGDLKNNALITDEQVKGGRSNLVASGNPLATAVHELGHWYQFKDIERRYPSLNYEELNLKLRSESVELVEKMNRMGYNVDKELSRYAGINQKIKPEEVYAELFVKVLLEGGSGFD